MSCGLTFGVPLWSGGPAVGDPKEPTGHELRQAEPLAEVLLREGHHAEGKGRFHFFFSLSLKTLTKTQSS